MYSLQKTDTFDKWLKKIKDKSTLAKILIRLKRIERGNLGDHKSIGGSISELRFSIGYRIYYTPRENVLIILLCGGVKDTQEKDIANAKKILRELENGK